MTDKQITVYLSVSGTGEEIYQRVAELLKSMGPRVIDILSLHFSVLGSFELDTAGWIPSASIFISILGDEYIHQMEQSLRRRIEIEYRAVARAGVPFLVYEAESSAEYPWLTQFLDTLSVRQSVHLYRFRSDDELLDRIKIDVDRLSMERDELGWPRSQARQTATDANPEEEDYNEHFEAARDRVAQLYEEADSLLTENKLSDAAMLFRDIIGILPNELEAYGRLRDVLERLGRTEEAKQVAAYIEERFPAGGASVIHEAAPSVKSRIRSEEPVLVESVATKPYLESPVPSAPSTEGLDPNVTLEPPNGSPRDSGPPPQPTGSSPAQQAPAPPVFGGSTATASAREPDSTGDPNNVPLHHYSRETWHAFAVAEALRRKLDHLLISRTNILFGLMAADTGLAGLVLKNLGISRDAMLELIGRRLSRNSKSALDLTDLLETADRIAKLIDERVLAQFPFSDNLLTALKAALSLTLETSPTGLVWPDYVFVSLIRSLEDDPGFIGWMLGKEKREWIQKTLADWPADAFTEDGLRDKAIAAGLYSPPSASSDAASKDDLLNFKQSAQAMVNIVLKQETVPPLVVGVYGPWGSGKSTYLELVKRSLLSQYNEIKERSEGTKAVNLLVVEYDAWAYSDAPKLWAGLITKIARKLDEDLGFWGRIKYLFKTHRARLVSGLLLGLVPLALAIPAVAFGLAKPLTAWLSAAAGPLISGLSAWLVQRQAVFGNVRSLASKFDSAPASGVINSIQDEFKDALESWIEQKTGADTADATIEQRVRDNNLKIVVFIDELDRCPLERIVDILEAIKLFLAKEIFIVFMAVDTRVASEAIRLHYKDVRNPDLPREYLEKIVQLPLRVPTAKGTFLGDYLRKFMPNVKDDEAADVHAEPSIVATPISAPASPASTSEGAAAIPAPSPTTKSIAQPVVKPAAAARKSAPREFADPSPTFSLPQLPDTTTELKMLKTISERFLESNPRRIKRLLNTYRYVKVLCHSHSEPVQTDEWQKTMLGWLTFTMTWPAFMAKAIDRVADLEPQNDSFLLRALEKIPGHDSRPTREDIQVYLNVSGERIKSLWELAGNFLIENADPGSVSHRDERENALARSSD